MSDGHMKAWEAAFQDCPLLAQYARAECHDGPDHCRRDMTDEERTEICYEWQASDECNSHKIVHYVLAGVCEEQQPPSGNNKINNNITKGM